MLVNKEASEENGVHQRVVPYIQQTTGTADRSIKYLSLVCLTLQNALSSILIRYTRIRPTHRYSNSTVILVSEVVKLVFCSLMVARQSDIRSLFSAVTSPKDTLKVALPSFLYVVQNNLVLIAASNLDVATFQITSQLKILTTAVLFVVMMRRKITKLQWVSLTVLTTGVSLVQLAQVQPHTVSRTNDNRSLGFVCILAVCFLSGFAGVYFEKILKGSSVSVWFRNVQLSLVSCPLALVMCWFDDKDVILNNGFFHGYDMYVWLVVLLMSLGGLLVAVVVKYADNILKGFATSFAIVLGCVANVHLFGVQFSLQFGAGTFMVMFSVLLYSYRGGR